MHTSVSEVLTYEVKQEIANRYFGFRKLIEEDSMALADKIRHYAFILEKRISFDLIRIYILLKDEALIERFMSLANIPGHIFYDPYLTQSMTIRKRVFEGVRFRGLTKRACFSNAILDCYERLIEHVDQYREKFAELVADRQTISEEIDLFYRKNDLGSILGFLRGLGDAETSGMMQGGMEPALAQDLEQKLRITPPAPIEQILPVLSPLPPLAVVRHELQAIIAQAYNEQGRDIHDYLSGKTFFARYSW